jgi:arginase
MSEDKNFVAKPTSSKTNFSSCLGVKRKYKVIGAASGWGAQVRTCEDGPGFIKDNGCPAFLNQKGIEIFDWDMLYPHTRFQEKNIPLPESLPVIADFNRRLSDRVSTVMQQGFFPVVIGGDHSNALGTWNGVVHFLSTKQQMPLGLIWIDAHMDSHTLETTPSGAWHGMPLASLMGYGTSELAELTRKDPILLPEHLCLIGTRSFEEGEEELLKRLNVKIYYIDEVKERGLKQVLQEAIAYVNRGTQGYGVSLDVDVVDPSEAPGTGCFEPNGLSSKELLQCLPLLGQDQRLRAFELVEFNPHKDQDSRTLALCQEILACMLH